MFFKPFDIFDFFLKYNIKDLYDFVKYFLLECAF